MGLLDTLLIDCFVAPAKLEDHDLRASVGEVPKGAVCMAFRLDSKAFRRAANCLDGPCCDGLFAGVSPSGLRLLFVEMKGKDHARAFAQLEAAVTILRDDLGDMAGRATFLAVVISDKAAPRSMKTYQKAFMRRLSCTLVQRSVPRGSTADLREVLWPEAGVGE